MRDGGVADRRMTPLSFRFAAPRAARRGAGLPHLPGLPGAGRGGHRRGRLHRRGLPPGPGQPGARRSSAATWPSRVAAAASRRPSGRRFEQARPRHLRRGSSSAMAAGAVRRAPAGRAARRRRHLSPGRHGDAATRRRRVRCRRRSPVSGGWPARRWSRRCWTAAHEGRRPVPGRQPAADGRRARPAAGARPAGAGLCAGPAGDHHLAAVERGRLPGSPAAVRRDGADRAAARRRRCEAAKAGLQQALARHGCASATARTPRRASAG